MDENQGNSNPTPPVEPPKTETPATEQPAAAPTTPATDTVTPTPGTTTAATPAPATNAAPAANTPAATPAAPVTAAGSPNSGMKKIIIPVIAIVILLVIGIALFTLLGDKTVFSNLGARTESLFSVNIPDGWSRDDSEADLIYYFNGNDLDTANDAVIVGFDGTGIPGYAELTDAEKDATVDLLESTFNEDLFGNAETGFAFNSVDAAETSHPEADRAVGIQLTGTDSNGQTFNGEGVFIITADGGIYVIIAATTSDVFETESDAIRGIISDFDVL